MSNPIQWNQNFTNISSTVVSTVAVEDALDNANVLVTRVAKGFANITQPDNITGKSDNKVYSLLPTDPSKPETGELLILPNGALITRVTLFKPEDSKLSFEDTDGSFDLYRYKYNESPSKSISNSEIYSNTNNIPDFPQKFGANVGIVPATSDLDYVFQDVTITMIPESGTITPGVLGINYEYVMPFL